MNFKEIKERIEEIKGIASDDPATAHAKEDRLYADFIWFIAGQSEEENLKKMAQAVLGVIQIDFPRWRS